MLETARLILRRWQDGDRASFAAMAADPEVMGDAPGVMSRSESNDLFDFFLACWAEDGLCYGAIERKADGVMLGMAGLAWCRFAAPRCPSFEIGWALRRAHWGQGYATEAARAWITQAFGPMRVVELLAFTESDNQRSQALLRRLGFRLDGTEELPPHLSSDRAPERRRQLHSLAREDWCPRGRQA